MSEMTPMMSQYLQIKKEYSDAILFFRLGDFYEMFFDDAHTASKVLELTLTARSYSKGEKAPMCGVPFHSAEGYIAKLVSAGYKVAICEQTEDPATAKGIVKRDVIRVITKGSIIENNMLDDSKNNYLACVYFDGTMGGVCFCDVSTGILNLTNFDDKHTAENNIINEIGTFSPSEILLNKGAANSKVIANFITKRTEAACEMLDDSDFDFKDCADVCSEHFGEEKFRSCDFSGNAIATAVTGALLRYLKDVQKNDLGNIREVNYYTDSQFMKLDYNTLRNLEILETMRGREKKGSLLWVLDRTHTSMGKRLLRSWLEKPLVSIAQITRRHNAVSELYDKNMMLTEISSSLSKVFDIERLITRVMFETANAKDLNSLKQTIEAVPIIKVLLQDAESAYLRQQYSNLDLLEDVRGLIDASIKEEAPFSVREGDIIKDGFNAELDELRNIQGNGKQFILDIEQREREATGIPKLKIGYNRVFGYYIEVTNSYKDMVPDTYFRKQTLANCERYITEELKELESKVLGAQERIVKLEYEIFCQIRSRVAQEFSRIKATSQALATIDVLCSLATTALERNYVCPTMLAGGEIKITDGRHPVVEAVLDAPFVPNDTYMDCDKNRCAIITGPNMAGKSTYMRQVAIIALLAQIGSFVPAKSAELCIIESIFTRVGASDDLATGQSTFMVEMNEVSSILKNATKNSLIILDEVGRGTSTFDGMSIARAVLEYIADKKKIGAKTLFSTHYHELTELEGILDGVNNYNICVKKRGDTITFLRRIVRGCADGSYGIEVAKLAGIPNSVVSRARVILSELEGNAPKRQAVSQSSIALPDEDELQLSMTSTIDDEIIESIRNIDINTLTPLEAMTTLHELIKKARRSDI